MRIALAQLNPTVGDLDGNRARILEAAQQAASQGAALLLTGELSLIGYPPRDLLELSAFLARADEALLALACELPLPCLVGHVARNAGTSGKALFNAISLLADGAIQRTYRKQLLPTYDIFDEARYFEPADETVVIELAGRRLGLTICEDIWNEAGYVERTYVCDPVAALAAAGAEVILNASASPWALGKPDRRRQLFGQQAREAGLPLLFCNQIGGNDELIFDGGSMAFDRHGALCAALPRWRETVQLVDIDALAEVPAEPAPVASELAEALVLGLRDYARKTGFSSVLVGLSGGIDSAVVAALAVEALGAERVTGVAMPSPFSSEGSVRDARGLAEAAGVELLELPIAAIFESFRATLAEPFEGTAFDVTEENLQARIRGGLLMALSNKRGALLLTTGNKSELAVGYCTLYGDMCGGLALISDVPKTLVYELAHELNRRAGAAGRKPPIPEPSISKPPSAELRPDQRDADSLPSYETLDAILEAYLERRLALSEIVAAGHDEQTVRWVLTAVDRNEYKRRQAAPGLRVTSKAFGSGRRMPIAQRFRHDG